jgi:H+/Cl- antiporter ClcA
MISGSGIPQVEGLLLRHFNMNWWKTLICKFVGGIISIGAGLSLGREGPSIQIGAVVGKGYCSIFKRIKLEEKFLITSGASAGLAAAFNAPLAGVIFSLEEIHKNFSPVVLTSALTASITADFISKYFFGLKPVFDIQNISPLPLSHYHYIILLGIILGVFGTIFNKSLLKTQDLYSMMKWLPSQMKPVLPFITAGILGFVLPQVLGGGHELIDSMIHENLSLKLLLLILLVKFLFTMLSYGSGAPGGIFLPLLVLGALAGSIYGNALVNMFSLNPDYVKNLIILAMAGYFSAIVKSPITGSILITEMTGSFSHLLSIAIISIVAYITSDMLGSKPIYESLLERMDSKGIGEFQGDSNTKVIIETAVCLGSTLEGKLVKELKWPSNCLLVAVKRGNNEIIPRGDTQILAGDCLMTLANENIASEIREKLSAMAEEASATQ